VTLAPDFLGFGQSDDESEDILLNRFQRPETVLSLLASIESLNNAFDEKKIGVSINPEKIFLWGHSNGGQIAISVLEISRRPIPTALWAPVSKGFPEGVLQYTSDSDDQGKIVIEAIEIFKKGYNPADYSINSYFDQISASLQIHQGTGDEYIDLADTDNFVAKLRSLGKNVTYYTYPGDDHNFQKNWQQLVERDLEFFNGYR